MSKRNPTDLIAQSSHNVIGVGNRTNEDEQESKDIVATKAQVQNELKKNYGIKSNIHIHL